MDTSAVMVVEPVHIHSFLFHCSTRDQVCNGEISGPQGSEYENDFLVGYCTMVIEAVISSEMSVSFYQTKYPRRYSSSDLQN
jgi:hypothetical protein